MIRIRPGTWVVASFLGFALLAPACAASSRIHETSNASSSGGGRATGSGGAGPGVGGSLGIGGTSTATTGTGPGTGGGSVSAMCMPGSGDMAECPCSGAGMTRACYPASINPKTRNVGACKDGQQTCDGSGEFPKWTACTGEIGPAAEACTDGIDNNCDGLVDCADPSCASDVACSGGCTDGQTRDCYDGPPGTDSTGICKPGTQTCVGGQWSTGCPGEVTPQPEVCSDFLDHNCNGLPGCFDFFNCLLDPACQPPPCMPANGCTCPMGAGDAALCPNGDYGDPQTGLCCKCTASTCDQLGCCGEAVCAGTPACGPLVCGPLDPSCGGMVNADCDFEDLSSSDAQNPPEDCDQTCCKCKPMTCP